MDETNESPSKPAAKKPYKKPDFRTYGTLSSITRNIAGGTGMNDNGGGGNQKTSA